MLLLREPQHEQLNVHADNIRLLSDTCGPSRWNIVYTADVRMRRECMDRIRRRLQVELTSGISRQLGASFDPIHPMGRGHPGGHQRRRH
eukprot:13510380-Alexandrium_andersonii.AAC.1